MVQPSAKRNEWRELLPYATSGELEELKRLSETVPIPPWIPFPGPQTKALLTEADELFYGGAAGGGKTDLMLGTAITEHRRTLFLRRESTQLIRAVDRIRELLGQTGHWKTIGNGGIMSVGGRIIQLAGCEHEHDKNKFQGHDDDLKCFDELPHFSRSQFRFIIGWNRTDAPGQRCRVIAGGNPPTTPEGRWVVEEWAPWLDAEFPDPAEPGELRWYSVIDEKTKWLRAGEPFEHKGELVIPRSRTFLPARVEDNPVYLATGYKSVLQGMPEPLRSQMLYGDFGAGMEDNPWQVIPTEWIRKAQTRWKPDGGRGVPLSCLGVDVAYGGDDQTVLARRHGVWFDRLEKHPGKATQDGWATAGLIIKAMERNKGAAVNLDAIGYGASAYDCVKHKIHGVRPVIFSEGTAKKSRNGILTFRNLRAYAYWSLREALDPDNGDKLALPPDPELLADLTAPRWELQASGVKLESKDEIKERIGRSPDCGDAVVLAHLQVQTPTARPTYLGGGVSF